MSDPVSIVTTYVDESKFRYVNGAFGTINSNGDYMMNFYLERPGDVVQTKVSLSQDGKVVNSFEHSMPTREVLVQLIMNIAVAESVANWIMETIKQSRISEVK